MINVNRFFTHPNSFVFLGTYVANWTLKFLRDEDNLFHFLLDCVVIRILKDEVEIEKRRELVFVHSRISEAKL